MENSSEKKEIIFIQNYSFWATNFLGNTWGVANFPLNQSVNVLYTFCAFYFQPILICFSLNENTEFQNGRYYQLFIRMICQVNWNSQNSWYLSNPFRNLNFFPAVFSHWCYKLHNYKVEQCRISRKWLNCYAPEETRY